MNLTLIKKAVVDSERICKETTEKVKKLLCEVTTFMGTFQNPFELSNTNANKVISSLGETLQTEKTALAKVRTEIKNDHAKLQTSITSKLDKLQEDLAIQKKIMDELVVKTKKGKVLSMKLSHANS